MAAPRAYWKGFLRLSLVSIPVNLYNAIDSAADISFRQIHKPSGRRVSYTKSVEGIGKIENSDIVKGYEVDKDQYVIIEPEEIDSIKLESKQTIDLVQFVDAAEVDYRFFERPYFLAPGSDLAGEGYVVIREALKKTGRIGLAQITISGREWLVAVAPLGDGLVMELLRYPTELRDPAAFFHEVPSEKPDKDMLALATQLIEQKTSKFEPDRFKDHYATALKALVQDKMKGKAIVTSSEPSRPSNVVDLMSALRKSIESSGNASKPAPAKGKAKGKPAKRA